MLKQTCLLLLLFSKLVVSSDSFDGLPQKIFKALERTLKYIYENRDMNIDGLFGIVLTEVQLRSIIKSKSKLIDTTALNNARNRAAAILKGADIDQMKLSHNNVIFAKYLLDPNIWEKDVTFRFGKLNNGTKPSSTKFDLQTCNGYRTFLESNYFSEDLSDECLVELIKSSIIRPNDCQVGKICSSYLVNNDNSTPGYGITHRLLFLQVSEARKCNWSKKWMYMKSREYCSEILWETRKNADCGFIVDLDDLFLEQIMLCGFEGFAEFLPKSWMEQVLSIQSDHGCFGMDRLFESQANQSERSKRESNLIKFGCIDHTTGLGAAVLSLFLRYLSVNPTD